MLILSFLPIVKQGKRDLSWEHHSLPWEINIFVLKWLKEFRQGIGIQKIFHAIQRVLSVLACDLAPFKYLGRRILRLSEKGIIHASEQGQLSSFAKDNRFKTLMALPKDLF